MKKKTKITKTLALALTLGLLCSGLAGCGQAQSVETADRSSIHLDGLIRVIE